MCSNVKHVNKRHNLSFIVLREYLYPLTQITLYKVQGCCLGIAEDAQTEVLTLTFDVVALPTELT